MDYYFNFLKYYIIFTIKMIFFYRLPIFDLTYILITVKKKFQNIIYFRKIQLLKNLFYFIFLILSQIYYARVNSKRKRLINIRVYLKINEVIKYCFVLIFVTIFLLVHIREKMVSNYT